MTPLKYKKYLLNQYASYEISKKKADITETNICM